MREGQPWAEPLMHSPSLVSVYGSTYGAHLHLHPKVIVSNSTTPHRASSTLLHSRGSCKAHLLLLSTLQLQWVVRIGSSVG